MGLAKPTILKECNYLYQIKNIIIILYDVKVRNNYSKLQQILGGREGKEVPSW